MCLMSYESPRCGQTKGYTDRLGQYLFPLKVILQTAKKLWNQNIKLYSVFIAFIDS